MELMHIPNTHWIVVIGDNVGVVLGQAAPMWLAETHQPTVWMPVCNCSCMGAFAEEVYRMEQELQKRGVKLYFSGDSESNRFIKDRFGNSLPYLSPADVFHLLPKGEDGDKIASEIGMDRRRQLVYVAFW